jgi:hypothetical protein
MPIFAVLILPNSVAFLQTDKSYTVMKFGSRIVEGCQYQLSFLYSNLLKNTNLMLI